MTDKEQRVFDAIKEEYKTSKRLKSANLHKVWRLILNEFSLSNFRTVAKWLEDSTYFTVESLNATNGRTPSMNTLIRKMAVLMNIRDPEFAISSQNLWDEPIAKCLEPAFNAVKDSMGWRKEMRRIEMDGLLCGTGIGKVGLSSKYLYGETAWTGDIPKGGEDGLSDLDTDLPYGPTTEYQDFTVRDETPNLKRIPPTDIFHNPGARRMDEVARTYHRVRRRLVDVVRDARYDREFRSKIRAVHRGGTYFDEEDVFLTNVDEEFLEDSSYTELVECFDHASRQFMVFSEFVDVPARKWTQFGLPIDTPYKYFIPIEHPELLWGIPYGLVILCQVLGKNQLRAKIIDSISRDGKTIHFIDSENIPDDTWIDRVNAAPDNSFIEMQGLNQSQRANPIVSVKFGGASADVLRLTSIVEGDLAEASGLTDAARNVETQGEQTATEAAMRNQQQGLTIEEFRQEHEDFQESCAADICQIMLSEWPDSRLVKVTGPIPELYFWVPLERSRVLKNFNLKIVVGSTERLDKLTLRRQYMEMLREMAPIADRAQADMDRQMQGWPPGPVDWQAMLKMGLDLFDPTLASKVLNRNDPTQLLIRLMEQYQIQPRYVSPMLEQMVRARLSRPRDAAPPAMQAPNVTPFPAQGPPQPAMAAPQMEGGMLPQTMAGNQTGRAISEAAPGI